MMIDDAFYSATSTSELETALSSNKNISSDLKGNTTEYCCNIMYL